MRFEEFLVQWKTHETVNTVDILASFLPLVRESLAAHNHGLVAPLEGISFLQVDQQKVWFQEIERAAPRNESEKIKAVERRHALSWSIVSQHRREIDVDTGVEKVENAVIAQDNMAEYDESTAAYLPGYIGWEHRLGHHDPTTDIFSLGMILASLALQLNFQDIEDLNLFVEHRRNLFAINRLLHPVIAQAIVQMTELYRSDRPQDLKTILHNLENYRDRTVSLEVQLALDHARADSVPKSRRESILTRLRDRLFDVSRRNPLLNFRATAQSLNLTSASMPLSIHVENIREDQIFVWSDDLRTQLAKGMQVRLNQFVNVNEAVYVPSVLERLMADARRDKNEFGCSQLRLVVAFLGWANLKEKPYEKYVSPLILVPIQLSKQKGIKDKYAMQSLDSIAEINPVIRHLFRQLYDIVVPETIDLSTSSVNDLFELLRAQIVKSEPAVSLSMVDRPQVGVIHEKAKRRLDQYRRSSRVAGRGASRFETIDYSYDAINYHPLGVRLFTQRVRQPAFQFHHIFSEDPPSRNYIASPDTAENCSIVERKIAVIRDANDDNPYHWTFDLCNLTLVNLHYRRMSLVRDYDAIVQNGLTSAAFEAGFADSPRPISADLPATIPLSDRFEVVASDPTQSMAIAEARMGRSYIVQGPPGTGKSQTITNLIADFVARGKRVLFVCEKRAAIDVVYARLKQSGLDRLCAIVHDSQTDKKEFVMDLKATYESFLGTSDKPAASNSNTRQQLIESINQSIQPLQRFEEAMESTVSSSNGLISKTVRELIDDCVAARIHFPEIADQPPVELPSLQLWWDHQATIRQLQSFIDLHCPGGIFSSHPFRLIATALFSRSGSPAQFLSTVECVQDRLQRLNAGIKTSGVPIEHWSTFQKSEQLLAYFERLSIFANDENLQLLQPSSNRSKSFDENYRAVAQARKQWESIQAENHRWKEKLSAEETRAAFEQVKLLEPRLGRWLSPTWWKLRALLKARYDFAGLAVHPTWTQLLESLQREYDAQKQWQRSSDDMRSSFCIEGELQQFADARAGWQSYTVKLPTWILSVHDWLMSHAQANEIVNRSMDVKLQFAEFHQVCNGNLECWESLSPTDLQNEVRRIAEQVSEFSRSKHLAELIGTLPFDLRRLLRTSPHKLAYIEADIQQNALLDLIASQPEVERFSGVEQSVYVDRLEKSMEPWFAENAAEICHRCSDEFRKRAQVNPSDPEFTKRYQAGRRILEHEFGKSMRYRPIRELVEGESGLVIKDLKPIWLMSPLSVADTLPLDSALVDVVIFDEASQVRLEEAIPSLFRGAQTIIVGDTMQLPPTNFFMQQTRDDSAESESLSESDDLESAGAVDLSCDSLLSHAGNYMPSTMLGWHYRSRSESLINFSNWAFYDGRLLTVPDTKIVSPMETQAQAAPSTPLFLDPSITDDPAVRECETAYSVKAKREPDSKSWLARPLTFHFLEDAVYQDRRNCQEAQYIASLVSECLADEHHPTIGVIAFSEAQQTEIERALEDLAGEDELFRKRYDAEITREENGQFVGLLVKNLENIQGDERDIILLSICYGPNPLGKVSMNFGPINRNGGEKRLNVAFSRAKQHMAIVTSMKSNQITNDHNLGPQCLKQYLRYVECMACSDIKGANTALRQLSKWQANSTSSEKALSPVLQQLSDALRSHGYLVDTQIGQSHFQIDAAVYRAGDTNYRLAILVDTVTAYSQSDPWERDVMRPLLLKKFGWNVHRVLGKDWYEDRNRELARILVGLEAEAN